MCDVTKHLSPSPDTIRAKGNLGFPKLFPHKKCKSKTDEELTLLVNFNKVTISNLALKTHLETNMNDRFQSLEAKVASLETKLNTKVVKPICPYCFEDFNSFTKIAQCLSGHMICWNCKELPQEHLWINIGYWTPL